MFVPGSSAPTQLDYKMRRSLADSLCYLLDETPDFGIARSDAVAAIEGMVRHRVRPGVFGRYYKLVPAIERGDVADAAKLFRNIVEMAGDEQSFEVAPFSEDRLDQEMSLYGELVASDPRGGHWLRAPPQDLWTGFQPKVHQALNILDWLDPSLAAELRGLISQVVAASPSEGRGFGGASSFMLWGLVLLNVETHQNIPSIIEGLVHEAAHQLLFAYAIDEPLVMNSLAERYPSPLRPDARPMDGVFHATFVTARLHYVCQKMRDAATSGTSCLVPVDMLDVKLATYRDLYFDGHETLEKHGDLTSTGRQVLDASLQFMRAS